MLSRIFAAALVASVLGTAPAAAQMSGASVRFGFGGGLSVPTSDAAEALKTGINGQAFVLVNTGVLPPLRFNVGYQRFSFDRSALQPIEGETSILSGVAGLNIGLMQLGPIQPYVTAGLGAFNVRNDIEGLPSGGDADSQTRFGIDGGAGLRLRIGRLEAFAEGRVQNVYTEAGMIDTSTIRAIPVTFGILF